MLTPGGSWSTQQLTEFVAAVSSCPDEAAAVRAAVERAAEALEELRRMRCELGQGYLFAKPLEAAELAMLLRRGAVAAITPLSARPRSAGELPGELRSNTLRRSS